MALGRLGVSSIDELSASRVNEDHVNRVIAACDGNLSMAAKLLGMHRRSLQRMLPRHSRMRAKLGHAGRGKQIALRSRRRESGMAARNFEDRITQVITEAAEVIAEMVRADVAAQVQQAIAAQSKRSRPRRTRNVRAVSKRNVPARCVFPDCEKPHKGPRFSFLCDDHMGISKAEKTKQLAAWRTAHVSESKSGASKRRGRSGRNGQLDEATVNRVLKVVEEQAGLRSEQIYKKLPLPPELTKKALAKLREEKRVKTKGERRGMTYATA